MHRFRVCVALVALLRAAAGEYWLTKGTALCIRIFTMHDLVLTYQLQVALKPRSTAFSLPTVQARILAVRIHPGLKRKHVMTR